MERFNFLGFNTNTQGKLEISWDLSQSIVSFSQRKCPLRDAF